VPDGRTANHPLSAITLIPTQRMPVPRSDGKLRAYRLAGKFHHADLIGRQRLYSSRYAELNFLSQR
jgi:hypothetical protein